MYLTEAARKQVHTGLSFTVRWVLALSCATCVANSNAATNTTPYLAYTSGPVIYRVSVNGSSPATVLNSSGVDRPNKLGIDFDYRHGRLFWVDSTQLNVMSSALDGSQVQTVASSGFQTVERVAYDWITQKVYWSDYGAAKIGIVDLRSGIWKVLIVTGQKQHSRPRALELDPLRRNMYWVDWLEDTQNAVIERASMDGQNRQIIVPTSLAMPYGITLDIASEKLYFIDSYYKRIESVNTDGTGRQQLHLFRTDIVAYSLVFHNGFLYWTDRLSQAISRLQIEGGAVNNVTIADVRPTGLTLIAPQRQPQVDNPCSTSGCSDICILSSSDVRGFTCACEEGVDLLEDTLTCTGSSPVSPSTTIHLAPSSTVSEASLTLLPSPPYTTPMPTSVVPTTDTPSSPAMCPCKNGGVCRPQSGSKVHCLCPTNYTGDYCERHISETGVCDLPINRIDPLCKNEGKCINTGVLEYRCECLPGYEGRYCEIRVNYGVCNTTKPCQNGGVCINSEDGMSYSCQCKAGFTGVNCSLAQLEDPKQTIPPPVFMGVIAGFALLVGVLMFVVVCVLMMLRKQKEKNKALESASGSNSPIMKKRNSQPLDESKTSSSDTTSNPYCSIPSIHNIYSQVPRRGLPPILSKYAKDKSYDELSRASKILTV